MDCLWDIRVSARNYWPVPTNPHSFPFYQRFPTNENISFQKRNILYFSPTKLLPKKLTRNWPQWWLGSRENPHWQYSFQSRPLLAIQPDPLWIMKMVHIFWYHHLPRFFHKTNPEHVNTILKQGIILVNISEVFRIQKWRESEKLSATMVVGREEGTGSIYLFLI